LAANKKPWTIAFWHHSPYSKSLYDSDKETQLIEMRRNVLPILENGGVDLVLSGHSHSYERSFLLEGHYGLSGTLTNAMIRNSGDGRVDGDGAYLKTTYAPVSHQGTVYLVTGSSGEVGNAVLNHPAMRFSLNALGSVVLDVDSNRVDAKFLDEQGGIRDYFTMIKSEKSNPPPLAPSHLAVKIIGSSTINLTWKDNSNNEEGFKIERKTDNGSFSAVAALGPNLVSYTDNDLSFNTSYTYRVRAYGTTSRSNYSNEASATTGTRTEVETRNDETQRVPAKLALHQNYPNPFGEAAASSAFSGGNPRTNIRFDLPRAVHVTLKVFNLMGEEVATLVNETRRAGAHSVGFSAEQLPGGIYFYELRAENQRLTRRLLLVK
jgi:hypothetical protein